MQKVPLFCNLSITFFCLFWKIIELLRGNWDIEYRERKNNNKSQLGFLRVYLLFCQTLSREKRQSTQVFPTKFPSFYFSTFGSLFSLF